MGASNNLKIIFLTLRKISPLIFFTSSCFVGFGCSNYSSLTRQARDDFFSGKFAQAAKLLEKDAYKEGVDQLLYLFDRATALHHAGDYEQSIKDFHLADKLAEIKDYTSLATEAATLVSNDRIIHYKGEDFENILTSQYLALNYLMLRKYEDALVECRRVNHKLYLMITEGKRKYKLNPMARYLSALIYEDQHQWDEAYIDYKTVHELLPDFPYLGYDLYRLAWINKIYEEAERWATEYGLSREERKQIQKTAYYPQIVVIIENGRSPEKKPNPSWHSLPKFYPRSNPVSYVDVYINDSLAGRSYTLFHIEKTAIENLDEKYGKIIAKKIAGVVAKEVVADQVGKQTDPLVGAVLRLGMYAADQADLRSWLTLPKDFQVFRFQAVADTTYNLRLQPKSSDGAVVKPLIPGGLEKTVHFDGNYVAGTRSTHAFIHVRL